MAKHELEDRLLPLNLQFFAEGDNPEGGEGGAGDGGNGEDGQGESGQDSGSQGQEETFSKEYVRDLRREAADYRTKLRNMENKTDSEKKDAVKSTLSALGLDYDDNKSLEDNIGRVNDFRTSTEKRVNDRLIKAEIKSLSSELGVVDAEVAYQLMDREGLKVNDKGDVEGAKEALESLLESKPFLKKETTPSNGGSDFGEGKPPSNIDDQIKEAEEKGDRSLAISLKRQKSFGN